jgi:hypothetical protein
MNTCIYFLSLTIIILLKFPFKKIILLKYLFNIEIKIYQKLSIHLAS